jgi:hypothetical protein
MNAEMYMLPAVDLFETIQQQVCVLSLVNEDKYAVLMVAVGGLELAGNALT